MSNGSAFLFFTTTVLIISGCTSLPGAITQTYKSEAEMLLDHKKPLNKKQIHLLADNQKAMTLADPVLEQSKFSERTVNTAHRRAALDAFSMDIVTYILNQSNADLVVHAGDILNNSCSSEYKAVAQTLDDSGKYWFVAPGNHDGYYMGLSSPLTISKLFSWRTILRNGPIDERAGWAQSCVDINEKKKLKDKFGRENEETGGFKLYAPYQYEVMDKTAFIGAYLKSLGVFEIEKQDPERIKLYKSLSEEGYVDYDVYCLNPDSNATSLHRGYLKNLCWTKHRNNKNYFNEFHTDKTDDIYKQWDEPAPWRNFIVQKLEFTDEKNTFDILIIDTSSYSPGVAIKENGYIDFRTVGAANRGHISEAQQSIITSMLTKKPTLIIGHHPLTDFDNSSYLFIEKLFERGAIRYISGDTHDGYDASFTHTNNGIKVHESNLGATIDSPIEYAIGGIHNGNFLIHRYSLTPLKERAGNEFPETGPFKKSKNPKLPKHYAKFNSEAWNGRCTAINNGGYRYNDRSDNPFHFKNAPLSDLKAEWSLKQKPLFGYRFTFYKDNLNKYKIDRLLDLAEIYKQLYSYANISENPEIIEKESNARKALTHASNQGKNWFSSSENETYYAMKQVSALIKAYEDDQHNHTENIKAKDFRLCSALFEAESEASGGLFPQ